MSKNLLDLYNLDLQEANFAFLVASIAKAKIDGTYTDITPTVVGGWYVSEEEKQIQQAELIADAVVLTLGA